MILSPPLVISKEEIDTLMARACQSQYECSARLKRKGVMKVRVIG